VVFVDLPTLPAEVGDALSRARSLPPLPTINLPVALLSLTPPSLQVPAPVSVPRAFIARPSSSSHTLSLSALLSAVALSPLVHSPLLFSALLVPGLHHCACCFRLLAHPPSSSRSPPSHRLLPLRAPVIPLSSPLFATQRSFTLLMPFPIINYATCYPCVQCTLRILDYILRSMMFTHFLCNIVMHLETFGLRM
jgi:hypothetical protein